jgi:hypothetical protein
MPERSCAMVARLVARLAPLFCTKGSISASPVAETLGSALIFESDMEGLFVVDPNTPGATTRHAAMGVDGREKFQNSSNWLPVSSRST